MAYLIDRINESLAKEGIQPRTAKSRAWLRTKISNLNATPNVLLKDRQRLRNTTIVGKMYFFFYSPKLSESLPFYDKFPLVIPIEEYRDGFLGLNLHYIHPKQRILLLDKLSETASNTKFDATTKLRLTYSYLKNSSISQANPCIKRYLYGFIKSRFLEIQANEWDIAALLPMESFENATTSKVYNESRKKF
jgi:hypothetical protein